MFTSAPGRRLRPPDEAHAANFRLLRRRLSQVNTAAGLSRQRFTTLICGRLDRRMFTMLQEESGEEGMSSICFQPGPRSHHPSSPPKPPRARCLRPGLPRRGTSPFQKVHARPIWAPSTVSAAPPTADPSVLDIFQGHFGLFVFEKAPCMVL